ncbi:hypothetical protein CSC70_02450 [Pseudoxanthomonas kalamensis DSM 18571]|uniref:autotransporter assembly complex protein TamA n=1 Tax=Pseudoxanthomonas kalamensis TaxID=289483 RepID=UPI001391915D|nr:autotransporter assembly complex family protein [Pseudoxanthomonas kalamensis]KAF1712399.1 hypothetical protein CSC70_02450 [Pseudoxanthomonas kalamensis DSM 18571]
MRFPFRLATAVLLALPGTAMAVATIDKVEIRGLDEHDNVEALMLENINVALSLNDTMGHRQGESRLEYLLSEAETETREALEPFGYYSPTVTVDSSRSGEGRSQRMQVVITVDKGEPVRVRHSSLSIEGEGGGDHYLKDDLAQFQPLPGEIFDHTTYEASKLRIVRRLAERGYLDADYLQRQVEVTRSEYAADIDLSWVSGIRYDMGPTTFHQNKFDPGLLEQLVYWDEGSYYHQGKLDRLRDSLIDLDYFSSIDIQPDPDNAVEGQVPIEVNLRLAKRDVYTAGLSYGTESGPGVRFGLDRRYVNSRGHKLSAQLDYASKRKQLDLLYRIPAFRWLDGWYGIGAKAYDEQTDYIDTRYYKYSFSRSGQISERWTATASLHLLNERWRYILTDESGTRAALTYEDGTYVYPELVGRYIGVDDHAFPQHGVSGTLTFRGGLEGAGSDANFSQVHAQANWYQGLGNSRLIMRGEAGYTFTNGLTDMPPSLRYYAGGFRSIRGYEYREVGPRVDTANGEYSVGAKAVLTGSVEFEHYLSGGPWGGALFVDTGSAFNDTPDWRTGVGLGLRWRSPVGPVRLDIARGLDDPDTDFQLYLSIGADL